MTTTSIDPAHIAAAREARAWPFEEARRLIARLDKLPDTAPIPAPPESIPLATLLTKYVELAITGEKSPKAALDEMHTELTKLLAARPKKA